MLVQNYFGLSLKMAKANRVNIKILFMYILILFSITVYAFGNHLFMTEKDKLLSDNLSSNYLIGQTLSQEQIDKINEFDFVNDTALYQSSTLTFSSRNNIRYDGNLMELNIPIKYYGYDITKSPFYENEILEYTRRTNKEILICGNYPKNDNEFLINERFIRKLGLNPSDAIGMEFSFSLGGFLVDSRYADPWISEIKLAGVYDDDLLSLSNNTFGNEIALYASIKKPLNSLFRTYTYQVVSLNEYSNYDINKAKISEEINMHFVFPDEQKISLMALVEEKGECIHEILLIFSLSIFATVVIYVSICQYIDMSMKKKYFGILRNYGMTKNQVFLVSFLEQFYLILLAFIVTLFLTICLFFALPSIMRSYGVKDIIDASFLYKALILTFFSGILFVLLINTIKMITTKKSIEFK